jgi:citrate lyase subunit beta / citryl-CoA lyase
MRSWLYCPGNKPKMILNAHLYGADGLVFDLEDSVSEEQKDEARILVAQAFTEKTVPSDISAVRINSFDSEHWENDLKALIPAGVSIIRIPKVETAEQIQKINHLVSSLEKESGIEANSVTFQCIFETPIGVENAFKIGRSSPRIHSYSFGAEDYCAAVGINRGTNLLPLDYPRSRIASAAAAFGYNAYDTVWGFLNDYEGLKADSARGKSLGYEGKSVIHPDQIEIVNSIFSPTPEEIKMARLILEKADSTKSGASAVNGRMIDRPVIIRAKKIIEIVENRQ